MMNNFYTLTPEQQIARLQSMADQALAHWGFQGAQLRLLKYRENCVFGVHDKASGKQFAMRIHRPGYHSDAALRSELTWMEALHADGIQTPEVIHTLQGELMVRVEHEEVPETRVCDLLAWVNGEVLGTIEGDVTPTAEEARSNYHLAGQMAASVHNQASNWAVPEGFKRPIMDGPGLVGERGYLGNFRKHPQLTADQLALLNRAANKVSEDLEAFGKTADRFGLTHADFLPENLLLDGETVRIIDFDDCGFGWYIMDLATSLFFLQGEKIYDVAREGLIEGYRSVRDLPDEHLELLPACLLARGLAYVSWVASRQETEEFVELSPMLIEGSLARAEAYLAQ
ncbi:MAG: phosphotransferase [Halioglobus sp.]